MKYIVILIILVLPLSSYSCDCKEYLRDSSSVMTAFQYSSIVGVVEVLDVVKIENSENEDRRIVTVKILRPYKGVSEGEVMSISSYISTASCGIYLETGIRYLLYAFKDDKRGLSTDVCTRTRIFTSSLYDLVVLEK